MCFNYKINNVSVTYMCAIRILVFSLFYTQERTSWDLCHAWHGVRTSCVLIYLLSHEPYKVDSLTVPT